MSNQKELKMKFAGRFIDLLGQQMYGGPVPAVAELVANAWDADAPRVEVEIPNDPSLQDAEIVVRDFGSGMTFDELDNFYLFVGLERRQRGEKTDKGRLVMGRKGIGKLAGFGIADEIVVRSVKNQRLVQFRMNYNELKQAKSIDSVPLSIEIDKKTKEKSGLTVQYKRLKLTGKINEDNFRRSIARRFAIRAEEMEVLINGRPLSKEDLEFEFKIPDKKNEWITELVPNLGEVKYWFGFVKETIKDPELRGVSIFARNRIAQVTPFFFNLSGGINGQVGLEYLTGQVKADFLDVQERDCIATDRQGVNWHFDKAKELEQWGQNKIKELCRDWKKRRSEGKIEKFRHDYSDLFERIENLPTQEKEDVHEALDKISQIEHLEQKEFQIIAQSILGGVERESVKKIIKKINATSEKALEELVQAINEWEIITAVSVAEVVIGRMGIIEKFGKLIAEKTPEKASKRRLDMQKFLKEHPWLLGPEYQSLQEADFHHEQGVDSWIKKHVKTVDSDYKRQDADGKRFDLLCIKDESRILVLELMRPGKSADQDHAMRLYRYVTEIQSAIDDDGTTQKFKNKAVYGILIADKLHNHSALNKTIKDMRNAFDAITWKELFNRAKSCYRDEFKMLQNKAPNDPRIKDLSKLSI